ncbi:MAG: hypothetical protein A2161_06605 [Candidatus Schekmanbacteria bacterium RBG_13_48_7]|uniref:RanBP2-type domain-containing protein n=1 Tax=Candidatus Schekmanbacteria bacterium RBG_13_48_7 TaxID=1817878 RepID=A0A1F7RV86_9BACT|nr:MAG: hypothetical protein A2161_06605 [Candidatus Schekmanbacteria bacterium RBG_13_48_7]
MQHIRIKSEISMSKKIQIFMLFISFIMINGFSDTIYSYPHDVRAPEPITGADTIQNNRSDDFLFSGFGFYASLYLLSGLIIGTISAHIAISKGYPGYFWFIMGFTCSIFSIIGISINSSCQLKKQWVKGLTKPPVTYSEVRCRICETPNHPSATSCSGCKHPLQSVIESEVKTIFGD